MYSDLPHKYYDKITDFTLLIYSIPTMNFYQYSRLGYDITKIEDLLDWYIESRN